MRLDEVSDIRVVATLSERNLIALLNKVRRDGSARELQWVDPETGRTLCVHAESDSEHYSTLERAGRPPGAVYPGDLDEPGNVVL